jgi:hypothetical protein
MPSLFRTIPCRTPSWRVCSRLFLPSLATFACAGERTKSEAQRQAELQAQHVQEVVAAGGVVDSILPIEEMLRRFRATIPSIDTLEQASPSLDRLVQRLAEAVGTRDSSALRAMTLTRREFAWLYYPESPLSRPPYDAPPSLLWGQILASSDEGARALVNRLGGAPIRVAELTCPPPEIEGRNRLHKRCTVRFSAPNRTQLSGNLFGTVLERDGRFKLISFANRI